MIITTELPQLAGDKQILANLIGSSLAISICQIANLRAKQNQALIVIIADNQYALKLLNELQSYTDLPVSLFPDWETLPFDNFSPHQDIISDRIQHFYRLPSLTQGIVLLPLATLMQRVPPIDYIAQQSMVIKKGEFISLEQLRNRLELAGYRHVDQVIEHGEYASRGALLDLFPMGCECPFRIDFFDNEIDSIRTFDVDNQRTIEKIEDIQLLPAHEFPSDKQAIEQFRIRFRERFPEQFSKKGREVDSLYQQVSKGIWPAGIEYWLPLFFEQTTSLFSYFPKNCLLITIGEIEQTQNKVLNEIEHRYEQRNVDPLRPLLEPKELWLQQGDIFSYFKNYPKLHLQAESIQARSGRKNAVIDPLPILQIDHKHSEPFHSLRQFYEAFTNGQYTSLISKQSTKNKLAKVIFCVESQGRREALLDLLRPLKLQPKSQPKSQPNLAQALQDPEPFQLIIATSEQGFIHYTTHSKTSDIEEIIPCFALICESDLFGHRVTAQRHRQKKVLDPQAIILSLAELQIGQPVVHLEHGIGRYLGLQTLETGGICTEYMVLEYRNESKLYLPVTSLHLISRYTGIEHSNLTLHALGTDQWQKARNKAAQRVRDVAAELLDTYAKRAIKLGIEFKLDQQEYQLFCNTFPFEETEDQRNAINAVIDDMCQQKTMDRLVCGDVGFGKTEVAMRAAFVAIQNGKQVAILVPTTLLAQQHYENFRDRFANFAVQVEVLSRFKSIKEQEHVIDLLNQGKIDILIGTHKLLQQRIKFSDLGLLVIDEEHRFGVRQKEQIKALRADVDILTLTATPIPRTLNMAMSGMRDLSIIATPPARRLAIKTFVRPYEKGVIKEAILREIMRGGQVYFLHNKVATIEHMAEQLTELVPEARIVVAHGQMREQELERVMNDFYHQRFNVLLCTTIIETGIDVPSANTIIINRADMFGLAQLHQLRGRVGRSHHQAYAYLLTPEHQKVTGDAKKRLEAIATLEDLGAGFALATHDLEIRGAGELLGDEQSGQIHAVGFSLYMEMLEQAVNALKAGQEPSLDDLLRQQTEIELRIPTLLPDDYIGDVNTRLSLYKRFASCLNDDEIFELKVELVDRFGLLPDPAQNLVESNLLKLKAQNLGIKKIELSEGSGYIEFGERHKVDALLLINLIQKQPETFQMVSQTRVKLTPRLDNSFIQNPKARFEWLHHLLDKLT